MANAASASGSPFLSLASQRISFLTLCLTFGSLVKIIYPSSHRNSYKIFAISFSFSYLFIYFIPAFSFSITFISAFSSCLSFAFLWTTLHRTAILTKKKEGKRPRIVLSNKRNLLRHSLEKILGKILCRLLIMECSGQEIPRGLRNGIGRLAVTLRMGSVFQSIIVGTACFASVLRLDRSVQPGPLRAGNLEIHGFTLGCSPGTTMRSLHQEGWPINHFLWEHDVKAAFESIDLNIIFLASPEKLIKHQMSLKLAAAIMDSDLVIREVYFPKSLWLYKDSKVAMAKQFPKIGSGLKRYSSSHLLQGSPLSPCLFNLFLLLMVESSEKLVVFGDNFYSKSHVPPIVSNCTFSEGKELRSRGRTLGLDYLLVDSRLTVTADDEGYARGVQRILDVQPREKRRR